MNKTIWRRLRNLYWIKTKSTTFLLTKVMTPTENGLTKELADQLARAARGKSAVREGGAQNPHSAPQGGGNTLR